jgi:telomerase reverse transcriptase
VHLNIFLNFALTAMKVPHYFDRTRDRTEAECDVIFTSLGMAAEYTHVAGRARVKHASRADRSKEHYAVKRQDFILCVAIIGWF